MPLIKKPHFHILGAGAIGTLVAFKLSQQHFGFSLIGRNNDTPRDFIDLAHIKHHLQSQECEPIHYLIICTKSTQALAAFNAIQHRLSSQAIIICLFNGLGAQQIIKQSTQCPVFFATTTEGVTNTAPGQYTYKGQGQTLIDEAILQYLPVLKLPAMLTPVSDIQKHLFDKLIINSLINPLTVIFNCKNGQLLNNEQAMQTMQNLACEIACWLKTYTPSSVTFKQETASVLLKMAKAVLQTTANNTSSMRQDFLNQKKTEIDFINGYWLNNNAKNIKLEHNAHLVNRIKAIETGFINT